MQKINREIIHDSGDKLTHRFTMVDAERKHYLSIHTGLVYADPRHTLIAIDLTPPDYESWETMRETGVAKIHYSDFKFWLNYLMDADPYCYDIKRLNEADSCLVILTEEGDTAKPLKAYIDVVMALVKERETNKLKGLKK